MRGERGPGRRHGARCDQQSLPPLGTVPSDQRGWFAQQVLGVLGIVASVALVIAVAQLAATMTNRWGWDVAATALGALGWLAASAIAFYAITRFLRLRRQRAIGLGLCSPAYISSLVWAVGGLPLAPPTRSRRLARCRGGAAAVLGGGAPGAALPAAARVRHPLARRADPDAARRTADPANRRVDVAALGAEHRHRYALGGARPRGGLLQCGTRRLLLPHPGRHGHPLQGLLRRRSTAPSPRRGLGRQGQRAGHRPAAVRPDAPGHPVVRRGHHAHAVARPRCPAAPTSRSCALAQAIGRASSILARSRQRAVRRLADRRRSGAIGRRPTARGPLHRNGRGARSDSRGVAQGPLSLAARRHRLGGRKLRPDQRQHDPGSARRAGQPQRRAPRGNGAARHPELHGVRLVHRIPRGRHGAARPANAGPDGR